MGNKRFKKEVTREMAYNNLLEKVCGCYANSITENRPCDNGSICEKCRIITETMIQNEITKLSKKIK